MVLIAVLAAPLAVFAGGALARSGARHAESVTALAGGVLAALVAADMLPDAFGDAAAAGLPAAIPMTVAVAVCAVMTTLLIRPSRRGGQEPRGCCGCRGTGRAAAAGLAAHGMLEGLVLGFGLGVGRVAWLLIAAFAVHKAAEGFALAQALRADPGPRGQGPSATGWWLLAVGLLPAGGALLGSAVTLPGWAEALAAAGIAGLVSAVTISIARGLTRRRPAAAAVVGAAGMATLLWALGG